MFKYKEADEIHSSKYDYSKVQYKNVDTKVVISCPIHGEFQQTPYKHINRQQGCGQCKGARISKSKAIPITDFITNAAELHNNKYDYSQVIYVNMHTKVIVKCPKHNEFHVTPNNHIYQLNGCPNCGGNTSKIADHWLASLDNKNIKKEKHLKIANKTYKVDGYDSTTKTIYEFFGSYWHGCPKRFKPEDINLRNKKSFGELYQITIDRIKAFTESDYNFIYIWEEDYDVARQRGI